MLVTSLLCLLAAPPAAGSPFDLPEVQVAPSPAHPARLPLPSGLLPLELAAAPDGPDIALLVEEASGRRRVMLWHIGEAAAGRDWPAPEGFAPRWIAWHPEGKRLYAAGPQGAEWVIRRLSIPGGWDARPLYRSRRAIERLLAGPRPFLIGQDEKTGRDILAYRLFFGARLESGRYRIETVTEAGARPYWVVGPGRKPAAEAEDWRSAGGLPAASALPAAFHPAGSWLIWEDAEGCFQVARYATDRWEASEALFRRRVCGGALAPTPNGIGLLHWRPDADGLALYLDGGRSQSRLLAGRRFLAPPAPLPDGRGLAVRVRDAAGDGIEYLPVHIPLADVVNAWMFLSSADDRTLLARAGGLLRPLEYDQLYSLYESEQYGCAEYPLSWHRRPYLVTTDIFWELFAAAYQGLFILRERQQAMPAFWELVRGALPHLPAGSVSGKIFAALAAVQRGDAARNEEAARILKARGREFSSALGVEFDYAELHPRGHYAADPEAQRYFKAVRYLSWATLPTQYPGAYPEAEFDLLRRLPESVKQAALRWIGAYQGLVAPPRAPTVWSDAPFAPPPYVRRLPSRTPMLFPLGWGFDNEVLDSTVHHGDAPLEGPGGPRLVPSGLDLAAALGSRFARELLREEIAKYPSLAGALEALAARRPRDSPTLYDRWLEALGTQWAEEALEAMGPEARALWRAKRLQTGLASWASLRHITVLVNERSAAQCGEMGAEPIVLRPPRGWVEPDPRAFAAIASLFDETAARVAAWSLKGATPEEAGSQEPLREGILRKLRETAAKARRFESIAARQIRGQPLTSGDYEEILAVGQVAEHNFLVFKSLAAKDLALSNPEPIPKIVDVAGGGPYRVPYLLAAVGRPLEWDHIVPFYGRRQIVKGAVYSYYEFASEELLDDAQWRERLPGQKRPAWIEPFLSPGVLPCPAQAPY